MALIRTEAFVVQSIRYGETSLICRLFTRERGIVPVIAKGVLRPKSRFGARLNPFQRLQVTYYDRPGRDIQTLSQVDMVEEHGAVIGSLEKMEVAGEWFRFVRFALPESAPAEPVYDLAVEGLRRLAALAPAEARRWETWHRAAAASLLGMGPRLETCAGCDRDLPDPRGMGLALEEGGLVCADCRVGRSRGFAVGRVEYGLLALYHHPDWSLLAAAGAPGPIETRVQEAVRRFIAWHLDLSPAAGRARG